MRNHIVRIEKLERQQPPADRPAWAELLDGGRAVLAYNDARRVEVNQAEIPPGLKCYRGFTPDDWDKSPAEGLNHEQP